MKPNIKSSIPLTFFRFSAATVLFLLAAYFFNYLTTYKDATQYTFNEAQMSSDGQVTYLAWGEEAGRVYGYWEFDETLKHSQRSRQINAMVIANSATLSVVRANVKNIERNSHAVMPINGDFYPRYALDAISRVIWWNGPAGQVDWYDGASRMHVASLGPIGPAVKAPARPKERFSVIQNSGFAQTEYLQTPQGVYAISAAPADFRAKLVYQGWCEAFGLGFKRNYGVQSENARLLIVHGNTLSVLDAAGALLRDIKLPEIAVSLFKERSGINLFDNGRVAIDGHRKLWDEKTILLLAEDGSLVRRVDYDTREINKVMNGGVDRANMLLFPTLMPPMPVPGFMEKSALIQSIALSLVLAAVVLWRQMQLGRRGVGRMAWVAFTLVFGLLGFATYLAAYRDRRSEPCPNCRRRRLVAEENCPHCNASWPAPKRLGIEIVETA